MADQMDCLVVAIFGENGSRKTESDGDKNGVHRSRKTELHGGTHIV